MRLLPRLAYRLHHLWWFLTRPVTLGVRLILERDGQVLLVKHSYRRSWYLPGGGVQRGEGVEAAARREAAEEVGATLGDLRLLGVFSNFTEFKSDHIVLFACDDLKLQETRSYEIEARRFFPMGDLPDDVSPGTRRRIREYWDGQEVLTSGSW